MFRQKLSHKTILMNQYREIMTTAATLDWSDFVLLSTKFLKLTLGDQIKDQLTAISRLYLDNQVEKAIQAILNIYQEHADTLQDGKLIAAVQKQAASLV